MINPRCVLENQWEEDFTQLWTPGAAILKMLRSEGSLVLMDENRGRGVESVPVVKSFQTKIRQKSTSVCLGVEE